MHSNRYTVQVREGAAYFTGPWNILDAVSSSLLLGGSACYFLRVQDGVRIAGALGAALKCFGLVDYLRSFSATGSLVRMISVRLILCLGLPPRVRQLSS